MNVKKGKSKKKEKKAKSTSGKKKETHDITGAKKTNMKNDLSLTGMARKHSAKEIKKIKNEL